jgi:FAD/FMN-containing dehydrogenase
LTFEKGYDRLKQFLSVKNKFDPNRIFQSMQSKRIGVS